MIIVWQGMKTPVAKWCGLRAWLRDCSSCLS